jgi:hypothetical protein
MLDASWKVCGPRVEREFVVRRTKSREQHVVLDESALDHLVNIATIVRTEPFELTHYDVDDVQRSNVEVC